jgi:hypothetical protein
MDDILEQAHDLAKGGVWSDQNLDDPIDWKGETGSDKAAIDSSVIRTPKTKIEVDKDVLEAAGVTQDVLNVISNRVEANILKISGASSQTIIQMVESKIAVNTDHVQSWLTSQNARISDMETRLQDTNSTHIKRLDEKLISLENKIDALTGAITQHGAQEARVIHEAYKIISERHTTDDGSDPEPSVFNRMQARAEALSDHLRTIEPLAIVADQHVQVKVAHIANVRRKFGKMI